MASHDSGFLSYRASGISGTEKEDETAAFNTATQSKKLGDLIVYLPDYGLIIPKQCRFAIQPTALPGHLLRHKVYRANRQKLLDRASKLPLRDPDSVILPSEKIEAISQLPVTTEYRKVLVARDYKKQIQTFPSGNAASCF